MTQRTLTVVVPALDEELGLADAVAVVVDAVEAWFDDYEILVFNDGSTDRTGEIADGLAAGHPKIFAFHHDEPHCIGGVLRAGWQRAKMHYVIWVDGQGATTREALDAIFARCGESDLVVPYASNQHERRLQRRIIATGFRSAVNLLFGLDLMQYTHLALVRADLAKRVHVQTDSYAYQAEALVKMIVSGATYVQLGVEDNFQLQGRRSKAFRPANVLGVASFLFHTFIDVYVTGRTLAPAPDDES